ncbi:tetratricopeptide repeat protein [Aquibium oceanicum]|nr:tetratricopeptide repeat protein [Aquibium oceanicum]
MRQVASAVGGMVLGQIPARNTRGQVGAMLRGLHARNLMTTPTREHWQEAFALEQSSMRDFPDSPWGYIGSALMLLNGSFQGFIDRPRDEVLDEAEDLAERALAMAPDNYMGHYTAARVLATRGHFREALRQFEEAARLNPSDPLVLIAMSMPLLFTGDTERAKAILEHARSVDPLHGDWLLVQLGWAHWQAGECEKGLDAMHRMASPPVSSLTMLASLQICTGDTAQARETIAALLEARPDYSIQEEIRINPSDWKPDGTLERWLDGLRQAGLPG